MFTLPAGSKVSRGWVFLAPSGAKRVKTFKIYRWNPDERRNPRLDAYRIDLVTCGPMVLDALSEVPHQARDTSPGDRRQEAHRGRPHIK